LCRAVAIPRELYNHMAEVTGYQGETLNGWICACWTLPIPSSAASNRRMS
jgi:hypothetical protein